MTGEEILLELASQLRMSVNLGLLPDEEEPLTASRLIDVITRAAERVGYRQWENDMGEDL